MEVGHTGHEIVTIKGIPYAAVPLEEYTQLIEDSEMLEDVKLYDQAMQDPSEGIPAEFVYRITVDKENPMKVYREYRGYTKKQLGEKVGVSEAYISQLENDKRQGSLKTLQTIAAALDVDVDDIV